MAANSPIFPRRLLIFLSWSPVFAFKYEFLLFFSEIFKFLGIYFSFNLYSTVKYFHVFACHLKLTHVYNEECTHFINENSFDLKNIAYLYCRTNTVQTAVSALNNTSSAFTNSISSAHEINGLTIDESMRRAVEEEAAVMNQLKVIIVHHLSFYSPFRKCQSPL